MNEKFKGFVFGAVAAATYGMNPLFSLPLYAEGMTVDSVLFYRYAVALIFLGIGIRWKHISIKLTAAQIIPLSCCGLLFAASSLCLFESYKKMDAGIASTILFVYPVMVAGIMAIFFREKLTWITIFSIFLALVGITLLYRSGNGEALNTTGVILVIFSALSYAIYLVWVNRGALKGIASASLTFYSLLFGLILFLIRLRGGYDLQVIPSWSGYGNMIALAILPTIVSLICMAISVRCIGSTPTAILGALEPVTAVFFGVVVFGEKLTLRLCIGGCLIIAAVTLIIAGKPLFEKFRQIRSRQS